MSESDQNGAPRRWRDVTLPNPPQRPIGWLALVVGLCGIFSACGVPILLLTFWLGKESAKNDATAAMAQEAINKISKVSENTSTSIAAVSAETSRAIQQLLVVTERLNKGLETNEKEVDRLREQMERQRDRFSPGGPQ
jgi:hypothetical protein